MTRRLAYALLAALALLLVAAQGASAASSQTIHQDAADGYIDGDYSVEELREANRTATTVMREYYGWDDIYREALRRKANPDAPPVAVPTDQNNNGKIDPQEKAAAEVKTRILRKKQARKQKDEGEDSTPEAEPCDDEASDDEDCVDDDSATVSASDDDGNDDGGSPLIWLIVGLPVLVVALGAWRMTRKGKGSTKGSDAR